MWISTHRMRQLGFRQTSPQQWILARRDNLHITAWCWDRRPPLELASFHVTIEAGPENLHVYFREGPPGVWHREGYTPRATVLRTGTTPEALCATAEAVATQLIEALGGKIEE